MVDVEAVFRQARSRRTGITADRVVVELEKLAFSNIFDLIELRSDGSVDIHLVHATRDRTAAIHDVVLRRSAEGSGNEGAASKLTRIQPSDKAKALEMLARHLGMFSILGMSRYQKGQVVAQSCRLAS
jgi:phage terminase small subunit